MPPIQRCHDAPGRWEKPGADNAPVIAPQALEHLPAGWSAGRRSVRAASLASSSLRDARASGWASQTRPQGAYTPRSQGACKGAVAQRPGASRRSIFPSAEGERKQGQGTRALSKTGSGALASSHPARHSRRGEQFPLMNLKNLCAGRPYLHSTFE